MLGDSLAHSVKDKKVVSIKDLKGDSFSNNFAFDRVFDTTSKQE